MTATDELVRLVGLDARGQKMLMHLIHTQQLIDCRLAEVDALMTERRADVMALIAMGVTKYKLAKLLDVSQTTVGNIVRGSDE